MPKREVCNLNVQTYLPFVSPITNATEFAILKLLISGDIGIVR
jgi:hypothetical protein